jgi:alpha-glucosidase
MLADNPTLYYRNPDCTEFISRVPAICDETKALAATAGEVAVVAKRKNQTWFIGGITNGKEKVREVELNLDFLKPGKTYTMTYFKDGIKAGNGLQKENDAGKRGDKLTIKMVCNGGWAAVLN